MQIRTPHQLARDETAIVRQERTRSKQMVQELLRAAVQKFKDTAIAELSNPTKLEAAYDAILFAGLAVFAAEGYRVSSAPGHHRVAIEGLAGTLKLSETTFDEMLLLLDIRNTKYTGFSTVKPADMKVALGLASKVLAEVEGWLQKCHPDLLKL